MIMPTFRLASRLTSFRFLSSRTTPRSPRKTKAAKDYEGVLVDLKTEGLRRITPNAMPIGGLAQWLQEGTLNVAPEYQRKYVWDHGKASRLVVTALCDRIVPAVTVRERENGVHDVVDGKQRLSTLLGYFLAGADPALHSRLVTEGVLPTDFSTLSSLEETYEGLNGLDFKSLSKDRQRVFSTFMIPVTTIPAGIPEETVFSCYEDINSGGEDLKAQQLRRAAFWGDYIKLLDELANNRDFQRIWDPRAFNSGQYQLCDSEDDRQQILRVFAWERNGKNYKPALKHFLNRELQHFKDLSDAAKKRFLSDRKVEFDFVMKVWGDVFSESEGAFRIWAQDSKGNWGWSSKISPHLFDLMYSALVELKTVYPKAHMYTKCKQELQDATKALFTGRKLTPRVQSGKRFVEQKNLISQVLTDVLSKANPESGPRRFPDDRNLRQQLHQKQGGKCAICNQAIDQKRVLDGSHAVLDHILPFSKGGQSTEDNAALVHKECNLHKGARIE